MAKITYLIGAGASAKALSVVSEMELRLRVFKNYLFNFKYQSGILEYIEEIDDLLKNISENTIDEYARMLNRSPQTKIKYYILKALLIGFFLFEQMKKKSSEFADGDLKMGPTLPHYPRANNLNLSEEIASKINNTLDKRYLGFLGKILNDENKFKGDVNILSWNYDSQFEIAMERHLIRYKNIDSFIDIFPFPMPINFEEFGASERLHNILKLNGTAGIFKKKGEIYSVYESQDEYFDDIITIILSIYREAKTRLDQYKPLLHFAWEKSPVTEYVLSRAKKMVKETEILVVLGYSFPDFNRDIDREIFSDTKIKKVYLQVNNDPSVLLNLRGLKNDFYQKVENVENSNSFFIPPEF